MRKRKAIHGTDPPAPVFGLVAAWHRHPSCPHRLPHRRTTLTKACSMRGLNPRQAQRYQHGGETERKRGHGTCVADGGAGDSGHRA